MSLELWFEKYRPKTIDAYVWRDAKLREKAETWIAQGGIDAHLLLSGKPGTGKTSLAKLMMRLMDIPSGDVLEINASRDRKIEDIQNKVGNFVNTWALGPSGLKYIILDEFDTVSPLAQRMLRNDMETFANETRFILTANYPNKIIEAIRSRCQHLHFDALDRFSFTDRICEILLTEQVAVTDETTLLAYVNACYPDMRKCINLLQQNSIGSPRVLMPMKAEEASAKDYMLASYGLFEAGRFLEARRLIVAQAPADEYPAFFRFLYENLALFGDTPQQQDDALLIIRDGIVKHGVMSIGDIEINLSATLVQLARVREPA